MVRILSIDGGGIRGIIPAMLLAEIERRTERPIAHLFDLVAGTSTGGIIALGLTIPKYPGAPLYSAQRFVELYENEGARIFHRSLLRAMFAIDNLTWKKYSSTGIEQVLRNILATRGCGTPPRDVLITSYEIERSFPFFFRAESARTTGLRFSGARRGPRDVRRAHLLRAYETAYRNDSEITTRSSMAASSPTIPPPARWWKRERRRIRPTSWWSRLEPVD